MDKKKATIVIRPIDEETKISENDIEAYIDINDINLDQKFNNIKKDKINEEFIIKVNWNNDKSGIRVLSIIPEKVSVIIRKD